MTSHNDEHRDRCEKQIRCAKAEWEAGHPGRKFTVQQVVADITRDQRAISLLVHSEEGAFLHLHNTFDEVLFDYDAFSRRDWSVSLRLALVEAAE